MSLLYRRRNTLPGEACRMAALGDGRGGVAHQGVQHAPEHSRPSGKPAPEDNHHAQMISTMV